VGKRAVSFLILVLLVFYSFRTAESKAAASLEFLPEAYDVLIAEEYEDNGLVFSVDHAEIISGASESQPPGSFGSKGSGLASAVPALAIRYRFINDNPTKKINLDNPFLFMLNDEYGNQYRLLPQPAGYTAPTAVYPANFPSVYPGQQVEETVFFEAPIPESRSLFLFVNATNINIPESIVVKISVRKVEGREAMLLPGKDAALSEEEIVKEPVGPLKILSPLNGVSVAPGETVHVEVGVPEKTLSPEAIFVVIPSYVLRDDKIVYHYDVTVPKDQNGPLSVVVIGKWYQGDEEEILSDSILLNVDTAAAL